MLCVYINHLLKIDTQLNIEVTVQDILRVMSLVLGEI
jgi:hypothetical protein